MTVLGQLKGIGYHPAWRGGIWGIGRYDDRWLANMHSTNDESHEQKNIIRVSIAKKLGRKSMFH